MAGLSGALITKIISTGTDQGDEHAYVECKFHDGNVHAIVFSPEMANPVCGAFLQASAHLEKKIAMKAAPGTPAHSTPITIEAAEFMIGKAAGHPDKIILTLTTKAQASLNFELSQQALLKIVQTMKILGLGSDPQLQ